MPADEKRLSTSSNSTRSLPRSKLVSFKVVPTSWTSVIVWLRKVVSVSAVNAELQASFTGIELRLQRLEQSCLLRLYALRHIVVSLQLCFQISYLLGLAVHQAGSCILNARVK
eukprot:TRINITY_DN11587_c0_g5_i2.p3 TRINITY_DN11587_c0_g5~~TRINITY_DN11587_c0_g5_i2.p3  ORF type:complete len:113 (-),score=13.89 TRINITY_DN11587_c0_g5_i2:201-539(-)